MDSSDGLRCSDGVSARAHLPAARLALGSLVCALAFASPNSALADDPTELGRSPLVQRGRPHGEELPPTALDAVSLSAPAQAVAGGTAKVSFGVPALVPAGSEPFWLDVYAAGTTSGEPLTRSPVPYGAASAAIALPSRPGSYEIRLLTGVSPKPTPVPSVVIVLDERSAPTEGDAVGARLERSEVRAGEPVVLRFAAPLVPLPDEQYWVTLVEASAPDAAYDAWSYAEVGARSVSLEAPRTPGSYELRLHSRYPTLDRNLIFRASVTVVVDPTASTPTELDRLAVRLERDTVRPGAEVRVLFDPPLVPLPGEQFWITIVDVETEDSRWGEWKYVPSGASDDALSAPATAGRYELRLHARYPTWSTHVLWRASFDVQ